jgi:hypothetical protein
MGSAADYDGCCELEKSILAIVEPFDTHRCPTILLSSNQLPELFRKAGQSLFLHSNKPRVVNISLPPNKPDLVVKLYVITRNYNSSSHLFLNGMSTKGNRIMLKSATVVMTVELKLSTKTFSIF